MKMKKIIPAAAVGSLLAANAIKASKFVPEEKNYAEIPKESVNSERVQQNLSKAIQCKTISKDNPDDVNWEEFDKFHKFLEESYPLVHKTMSKEVISNASLVFIWKGQNPDLEPMALLSHQDVVPVTSGTEKDWVHDPFEGYNDGEFIWGRGAVDMKNHLICVMEACETLIEEGFQPERDVYLCFGHNEEVVCSEDPGAENIVKTLKERGIHFDSLVDEGGAVLDVNVKGIIDTYIVGIGMAEKGYCDFKVTVKDKGGHTSQSPAHNGLGKLANVIKDLEGNQCKVKWLPFMDNFIETVGRTAKFPGRLVTCNYKLLKPVLKEVMKMIPASACLLRTVTGVSMCEGSPAPNVLPQRASVTVNFRPITGETIADVEKHIRKVVRYKDIDVELLRGKEPSRFSPVGSDAYNAIDAICTSMFSEKTVATTPYLVMGGTDAYFYEEICENVLRFAPFRLSVEILQTTHGTNERIPVKVLDDGVAFFKSYIRIVSKENR